MRRFRWQANIVAIAKIGYAAAASKAAPGRRTPYRLGLRIVGASILAAALGLGIFASGGLARGKANAGSAATPLKLGASRSSPSDLEIGLPPHATRFLTREQLLALPQVTFTVRNDANFRGPVEISGVALDELMRHIAGVPAGDLAIAICSDKYQAHYPREYIDAHHPVLVLKVNGHDPEGWPKAVVGHDLDMGPYLISSLDFKPSFKVLSYSDEPQIPWGVVRLEFRGETAVFDPIKPRGPTANSQPVQDGYRIARQNCYRCHNSGGEGGEKAQRPWTVLATWAQASPEYFAAYVRDPRSKNPKAQMEGFPEYDDATAHALTAYFKTFSQAHTP